MAFLFRLVLYFRRFDKLQTVLDPLLANGYSFFGHISGSDKEIFQTTDSQINKGSVYRCHRVKFVK